MPKMTCRMLPKASSNKKVSTRQSLYDLTCSASPKCACNPFSDSRLFRCLRFVLPLDLIRRPCGEAWRTKVMFAIVLFCFFLQQIAGAQVKETRRLLIVNDLGINSSPGFAEIDQAIFASLQKSSYQIELYDEDLEVTLFPDEDYRRRFREEFIRRYSNRKPDVIIAAGSGSFEFLSELGENFLRDTPIIFCAIVGQIPDGVMPNAHFTGVLGKLHPAETLSSALRLLPGTKHVVVVGGMGRFDNKFETVARESFQAYKSKLEFTYLFDLTMPALLDRLKQLPSDTIVYHTAITQDAAGSRFIDSTQAVPLVVSAANAPVFVMDDVDFRPGTVGGDLVNWADDGRIAAEMAVRVLNGEKPDDIPIVTSKGTYMFDWRALRRWGLKESDLPPGSIVLNRPATLWENYKRYILAGLLSLLAQTLIIIALLLQRGKRKRAETSLRESEQRFRLVANSAPVMIWMSGPDKLCTFFNECWLDFTGRPFENELGNGWASGVHPKDLERCLEVYSRAFDARDNFEMEYRLRRHDGQYRWVNDVGVPRFGADGGFQGYIGSAIDVTDRKRSEEALLDMSGRLIKAHEEERARIALELHDDLSQRMALLHIGLDEFEQETHGLSANARLRLHDIARIATEVSSDIHELSHELHPSKLDSLGLVAAVGGFCREFSRQHGLQIQFVHHHVDEVISKEVTLCLFRIVQEALRNVVKHSGSGKAEVELSGHSDRMDLSVSDTGVGFDPKNTTGLAGIGLISMRERLRLVGGHLSVESQPSHGTRIRVRVPLTIGSEQAGREHKEHGAEREDHASGVWGLA
jgi:PAS domain S-box-containing protein